jgi:hypothetical protein
LLLPVVKLLNKAMALLSKIPRGLARPSLDLLGLAALVIAV